MIKNKEIFKGVLLAALLLCLAELAVAKTAVTSRIFGMEMGSDAVPLAPTSETATEMRLVSRELNKRCTNLESFGWEKGGEGSFDANAIMSQVRRQITNKDYRISKEDVDLVSGDEVYSAKLDSKSVIMIWIKPDSNTLVMLACSAEPRPGQPEPETVVAEKTSIPQTVKKIAKPARVKRDSDEYDDSIQSKYTLDLSKPVFYDDEGEESEPKATAAKKDVPAATDIRISAENHKAENAEAKLRANEIDDTQMVSDIIDESPKINWLPRSDEKTAEAGSVPLAAPLKPLKAAPLSDIEDSAAEPSAQSKDDALKEDAILLADAMSVPSIKEEQEKSTAKTKVAKTKVPPAPKTKAKLSDNKVPADVKLTINGEAPTVAAKAAKKQTANSKKTNKKQAVKRTQDADLLSPEAQANLLWAPPPLSGTAAQKPQETSKTPLVVIGDASKLPGSPIMSGDEARRHLEGIKEEASKVEQKKVEEPVVARAVETPPKNNIVTPAKVEAPKAKVPEPSKMKVEVAAAPKNNPEPKKAIPVAKEMPAMKPETDWAVATAMTKPAAEETKPVKPATVIEAPKAKIVSAEKAEAMPVVAKVEAKPVAKISPDAIVGQWGGSYDCGSGPFAMNLDVKGAGGEGLEGILSFFSVNTSREDVHGKYKVKGLFDGVSRVVTFTPDKWLERPANFNMFTVTGTLTEDGKHVELKVKDTNACLPIRLTKDTFVEYKPTKVAEAKEAVKEPSEVKPAHNYTSTSSSFLDYLKGASKKQEPVPQVVAEIKPVQAPVKPQTPPAAPAPARKTIWNVDSYLRKHKSTAQPAASVQTRQVAAPIADGAEIAIPPVCQKGVVVLSRLKDAWHQAFIKGGPDTLGRCRISYSGYSAASDAWVEASTLKKMH